MTHSTAIHSTITNQQQATSVSPLEQSGSSKSEILKSFKAGKLRKNAKNKIALLLSVATNIVLKTQSMGMDDCWNNNEPKVVDVDFFWKWYEAEYRDLEIYVTVVDGVLMKVRFSDCPYHFSTDIVLTFDAIECEESEAEAVELETIEPVELATIESFNDFDEEKVIEKIEVVWSESNHFEDGEILTLAQYNEKSIMEALEIGRGQGYVKTKITVHFQGEEADTMRHDIDADYPTLNVYLAAYKIRVIEKAAKIRVTYADVKNALEQGYISPLNHDQKQPEPTPPSDDVTSRKVVSLGDYQDRLESKRERLEARAEKANAESNHYYTASKSRASMIPFGQPILVGHHSEKRARRDADRIFNDMGKSVAAARKAERLEDRAANVGRNGIASDDPEAIQKLKEKLAGLERSQETMKAINKVIRSKHMTDADKIEYMTQTHNLTEDKAKGLIDGDFCGREGYPSYKLTNNSATIRTTKQRIEELEALHNQSALSEQGCIDSVNWSLFEEDGRIKVTFDAIPSEEVRKVLKSNGFKWSRYSKAWVRKITANAVATTLYMIQQLKELK